ncbi:hypothetical protein MesoLj113a_32230 [Mesorhizobium sp. 113-1-2]|nr:hypothetical protein MesoLj113a_32230 [Mesorhizobium sp. 113-1-2]
MEKPVAPWPLLQFAIEAKSRADEGKLRIALSRLADEDPWFHVKWDEESGQTIVAAMGEVELEGIIDRVRREFNLAVNVGAPQIAYRETITRSHQQDYTHKKLLAGTVSSPASRSCSRRTPTIQTWCSRPGSPAVRFRATMWRGSKRGCAVPCRRGRSRAFR